MTENQDWRAIVASSLGWEQAHATLESAIKGLAPALRGQRPDGYPHSVWELLEHIRITQRDLLDFCAEPDYEETLAWPKDYWPASEKPPTPDAWDVSLESYRRDRQALGRFAADAKIDLTTKIPRGTGQTYLRTILVAVDHASYHVGQIIAVRRLLGAWPAA